MSGSRCQRELVRRLKELQASLVDGPAGPHLRAWCDRMIGQRRHWGLVTLTQMVVRSVDGLYVLAEIVRQGMSGWALPAPVLDDWERMYRRPRSPEAEMRSLASVRCSP